MPTANRRALVPSAILMFLRQDYPGEKELVIVDDGEEGVADLIPRHPQINYIRLPDRRTIGEKRNIACEAARGDIILHWDDDDWYAPWRIRYQVEELTGARFAQLPAGVRLEMRRRGFRVPPEGGFDLCGLTRALFVNPAANLAWDFKMSAPYLIGATLCYARNLWAKNPFLDTNVGEDTDFCERAHGSHMARIKIKGSSNVRCFMARLHGANTVTGKSWSGFTSSSADWRCKKLITDQAVKRVDLRTLVLKTWGASQSGHLGAEAWLAAHAIIGKDWDLYFGGPGGLPNPHLVAEALQVLTERNDRALHFRSLVQHAATELRSRAH
jgi:hypothetical protein